MNLPYFSLYTKMLYSTYARRIPKNTFQRITNFSFGRVYDINPYLFPYCFFAEKAGKRPQLPHPSIHSEKNIPPSDLYSFIISG
jgi:hypothetical protein